MTDVVLGLDLGASTCRAVLADTDGRRRADGRGPGANPCAQPLDEVTGAVAGALKGALARVDAGAVRAVVVGMAGRSGLADAATRDVLDGVWGAAGLRCAVRVRPDCEVAFAAGTPAEGGTVVLAGTGSMVALVRDRVVAARSGGYGWLLGDEGSAFWLGREAVRSTLRALQDGARGGPMVDAVLGAVLAGAPRDPEALTSAVYRDPPVHLAGYAPLVCAAAAAGDPAADALLDRAAELLAAAVRPLCRAGSPVVLAGALLTGSPVGARLRARLSAAGVAGLCTATDPAGGAAWLAALHAGAEDPPAVHARLLGARAAAS